MDNQVKKHKLIVFGENHHNTLGLIRSLGEVGLYSTLVLVNSNKIYPFVAKSRYVEKAWIVNSVHEGLDIILNTFSDEQYHPIIYPTYDSEVKVLSENYALLQDKFIMPSIINRSWTLSECLNKEFMRILANRVGMYTPQSWIIDFSKDVKLPVNIVYPCLVKAIDSSCAPKNYDIITSEKMLLNSIHDLKRYCDIVQIQEFILKETEIILLGWSDGQGNIVIPCLMDKIREYPRGFGTTGLGKVTKKMGEYICLDKVYEYLNLLGYSGLFSVEFLLSNNKAYFLEINLRNDGNGYLPTYGGVNLPYQWYLAMTNQQSKLASLPKYIEEDFMMMREFTDIMIPFKYGYSYVKWFKDFCNVDCFLYWNKKDKKPYFYFVRYKLFRLIRKMLKRICGKSL